MCCVKNVLKIAINFNYQELSRKRKLKHDQPRQKKRRKESSAQNKRKEKAHERELIPIVNGREDMELSDQDFEVFDTYGDAATFLNRLDQKGLSRREKLLRVVLFQYFTSIF
jgi:hypothetical protein